MQNTRPDISIIVPVYNVSTFLSKCLDSILNQTFENWECIVVDDGSTDDSGKICDEYGIRDNRFKIIHIENSGVSETRNVALRNATGNFIAFCDSDDWMEPDMMEYMRNMMIETGADIVQVGFWLEFESHKRAKHFVEQRTEFDRDTAIMALAKDRIIQSYVWNKMYRRELVGPDFPIGKSFEDVYVGVKWFRNIKKIVCDPTPLYHYRMRNGSIVNSNSTQIRLDYIEAFSFRAYELTELGLFTPLERDKYISIAIIRAAKDIANREKNEALREKVLLQLSQKLNMIDRHCFAIIGRKKRTHMAILRKHPRFFCRLTRWLHRIDVKTKYRNRKQF